MSKQVIITTDEGYTITYKNDKQEIQWTLKSIKDLLTVLEVLFMSIK